MSQGMKIDYGETKTELLRVIRGLSRDLLKSADKIEEEKYLGAASEVRGRAFEIEKLESRLEVLRRYKDA